MTVTKRMVASHVGAVALVAIALGLNSCGGSEDTLEKEIATPAGVGELHLGASASSLRRAGLIGSLRKGCELGGGGQKVATLKPPLHGTAVFSSTGTGASLSAITTTSGTTTQAGVRIGSTVAEARSVYPGAEYTPPHPREPIPTGFIWVGGTYHPRMTMIIDPLTHRVIEIDVPVANLCE